MQSSEMRGVLKPCRVLPVITVQDVAQTVTLSRTLLEAGMPAVELTLRTPAALEGIAAVKAEVPGLLIAAGTVTSGTELDRAMAAGADFAVSPGLTSSLLEAARQSGVGLVPGVASPSDIMLGLDYGLDTFKLFPAGALGGIPMLKALGGPFPQVSFCPTGGLSPDNFRDYLALPNVICCGGSWMVAPELVASGQWDQIATLAADAMATDNN
ncbi:bifunctional 4-hydroxy-2-oxoglutarate aldolase/2-dehydro-3-deoxy-phosphogluconate aldolase [Parahaliea aestuarii]|nr:bifunctional 4-hydroxy-2-oxoglutarate aldolase/2-dehydro-3-deoxy-phosphogluconate aldolase [Parahaliea aestuarii]